MKRAMSAAVLIVGLASVASAQIIRPSIVSRPSMYTSLSIGLFTHQVICDPASNACWNFGDGAQYRAAFEVPISIATTVGLSYAHANLPLLWADTASCSSGCDARSEVHQFMALLHLGTTGAFTQMIDISAGATRFANFKTTGGTPLGPGKGVTDFSFGLAYGLGIRLTPTLHFTLQQDYGVVFHKRMPGAASGTAEQRTIRAGLRLAM
jgi:opacity protein-like surface antigen